MTTPVSISRMKLSDGVEIHPLEETAAGLVYMDDRRPVLNVPSTTRHCPLAGTAYLAYSHLLPLLTQLAYFPNIMSCEEEQVRSMNWEWRFLASTLAKTILGQVTLFFRRTETSLGFGNRIRKLRCCKLDRPYKLVRQFEASILVKL
jgi:hypothetical protein